MNPPETQVRPVPVRAGAEPVNRVAVQVDRLCWGGISLGLAFTMSNVQSFAAAGARTWSLPWWSAWLLDPMVSLVLLAILRAEQVTARHGVRAGGWARAGKWFTLAATYVMNTWQAFTAGSPALVVLHSVPPLVVFVATEAVTDLRDTLGRAMTAAFMNAPAAPIPTTSPAEPPPQVRQGLEQSATQPAEQSTGQERPARRTTFAEYLDTARVARSSGVDVTPAWVREVTGCSRGLSSRLAATLRTEAGPGGAGVRS